MSALTLGYVGLGDMGGALATRLASRRPLRVFDLDGDAVAAVVERGATPAQSLDELGAACEVVLLCLPTSRHVESVLFGDGGLTETLASGALVIDQTSGDPARTVVMAAKLAGRGIDLVDAPVSGGAAGALAGTISVMLGSPDSVADRARDVLGLISDNVTHIGPTGTGHTMKLVNNLISCTQRLVTLEGLALAAKKGIDPLVAVNVLTRGGGRNAFLEVQAAKVIAGTVPRDEGFSLGLAHKDLALACDVASDAGVPTFYASLSRDLHRLAMSQLGDTVSVETLAEIVEAAADVDLVRKPAT